MPRSKVLLTVLNAMAGADIERACAKMAEWGIRVLDLKDHVFGKAIEDLTEEEARAAALSTPGAAAG
jgi:hypothetical protein